MDDLYAGLRPALRALEARGHLGMKLGLENIQRLLTQLDHPEQAFPVVLIAGTNGKGSTGAFLAHALKAGGFRVGWTTSPHLISPAERIWIDGSRIGETSLDGILRQVFEAEARAGVHATYFELMVAAAMLAFRLQAIQVALVEVGMGGRWDSTNALDPMLTVLTSVGMDHMQHLGSEWSAIAREKLCTARSGRPLVLGPGLDPADLVPLLECEPVMIPAPPVRLDRLEWDHSIMEGHRIGLPGAHQASNLASALEVLRQMRYLGFQLPSVLAWKGLKTATWPGRIWKVPGLQEVWMDGAHNPDGARALASHAVHCRVRPHLVFGAMEDKDLRGVARELRLMEPLSLSFVAGDHQRYARREVLCAAWEMEADLLNLTEAAALLREPCTGIRLVTGSLYLLGDLLKELGFGPQF